MSANVWKRRRAKVAARGVVTKETLIWILVVLFVVALLFGGLGAPHGWGAWGWSPAGLVIVLFLLVLLVG